MTDPAGITRATPPVAVVGLACRFPDSDDPAALLDTVLTGRQSFRRLPPGRIDLGDYYQPDRATFDATYSTRAAVLEGWHFEGRAFGIEDADYIAADPAHWLALETAARALAAAGLPAGTGLDRDRTGVIIGNTLAGDISRANALRVRWPYVRQVITDALNSEDIPEGQAGLVLRRAESTYLAPFPTIGPYTFAGSLPSTIAAGISSYFGFRGGSHAVDAACSSSLQAVASACAALADGDLDAAIAGGVDLSLDPLELIGLAKAGLLATRDVRIYDEKPTGYLPGEGCGVVVLMRTADAVARGLPVYAEILGWGTSAGSAPAEPRSRASSQLLAMRRAYERSGINPVDIDFIEGNGAGTAFDDDAELAALASIRAGARRPAALGSVKANIGHAKAAAGAAGLIKTVLALSTGVIPPATGVSEPHELISSGDAKVELPQVPREWDPGTRLAAVSTMGIGGSNVHLVLRQEPAGRVRQERWVRSVPLLAKPITTPGLDSVQPRPIAVPQTVPFLVHAPDRFALAAVLSRIADTASWLSDAEMQDLACLLGRDTAKQGPARVGIVAGRQEQLAMLAREAVTMLPYLADGLMAVRPGVFASDDADGRVTVLLSGALPVDAAGTIAADAAPAALRSAVTGCLDTLRWLESMDVHANAAVGQGLGALAGLAWAGVLGEAEVVEIAELRAQFLSRLAAREDEIAEAGGSAVIRITGHSAELNQPSLDASGLRAAIAQRFRFGPPRRRLMSALTGEEIRSVDDAIGLICTGFAGDDHLAEAITAGAIGATLLMETGPGRALVTAAAEISKVPAISLESGAADPASTARVAAALFAAGALAEPKPLFIGRQPRPLDIWREQTFITSPCSLVPQPRPAPDAEDGSSAAAGGPAEAAPGDVPAGAAAGDGPAEVAAEAEAAAPSAGDGSGVPAAADAGISGLRDEFERRPPSRPLIAAAAAVAPEAEPPKAGEPPATNLAGSGEPVPYVDEAAGSEIVVPQARDCRPADGIAPWVRCFTEGLRAVHRPAAAVPVRPWRMYAAARSASLADLSGLFTADPSASRTLAIVEDPADERSRATAIEAARDALATGELLVLTTSGGFTGFFASLHAENPAIGITVLRVPPQGVSPASVVDLAAAEPGQFRELVLGPDDVIRQPFLAEVPLAGGGDFPLSPDDVILISRSTRGAGLALAQVLACCGTGVAVVGRTGDYDDAELVAGLEELRSAGARIGYEVIDIADPASLAAAVERIEDRLGPVTAIAHGASPDDPVSVRNVTGQKAAAHLGDDAGVLDQLAQSIRAGQLKLIISFGTAAGRYGRPGASTHALREAALVSRAVQLADSSIGCRALHLDFPAWTTAGFGDRPELAAELTAAGTTVLDIGTASRLLLKVMTTPGLPRSLAVHGRVSGLATAPVPAITAAELRRAGLPGGGRFLRDVSIYYPGVELISSARLSLTTDPYLAEYEVDGMPVLPPALALDALAQAASVLAGKPLRRAVAVSLESPVLIPSGGEAMLRVCAQRDGDTIVAVLRCADSSYLTDHARAEFSCAADAPETPDTPGAAGTSALHQLVAGPSGLVDGAELYGPICFQAGRFRRVALLPEVTARSGRALARGSDDEPWFAPGTELAGTSFLLGDPGLNDAALQVLQACVPHRRVRAAGCESVQFSGRDAEGPVEIRAIARPVRAGAQGGPGRVRIPGQGGVPEAERGAGRQAAAGPARPASPARPVVAAVPPEEMTPEERADMEGANRRPPPRRSRRPARRQDAPPASVAAVPLQTAPVYPAGDLPRAAGPGDQEPARQHWDIEAVDAAGQLLASWRGVELHDAGPLPRNAAWPPTLLSVYLERRAMDLGLDDGLRITVSCGQPEAHLPELAGVVPRPSPSPDAHAVTDGRHAGTERRAMSTALAPGTGALAGFGLLLRAPVPVAGGWATVSSGHRQHETAPGMASAYAQLRASLNEAPAVLSARLDAVAACLQMADLSADGTDELAVSRTTADGWAVLRLGRAAIACAVVELSGVGTPVAIAILTRQRAHARPAESRPTAPAVTS